MKSFLERVISSVEANYLDILEREDSGEIDDEDDVMNTLFDPMMAEEIAIRAVYYELNALVEAEQTSLVSSFPRSRSGPSDPSEKLPWEMKREQLAKRIQKQMRINLEDIPGASEVEHIRQTANAYKHRLGYADPRRPDEWPSDTVPSKYELKRDEAFHCISAVREHFGYLDNLNRKPEQ